MKSIKIKLKSQTPKDRVIKFVASSPKLDRHGESVDLKTLRLPLKNGESVEVQNLPKSGQTGLDIPLMLNHSFDVRDVIGSVKTAYYENDELIFEAKLSNRKEAKDVLILLEEGHLSNAFSITMSDYEYLEEDSLIKNAEVLEVSLVFRGANRQARLLSVKALEGVKMEDAPATVVPEEKPDKKEDNKLEERVDNLEKRVDDLEKEIKQDMEEHIEKALIKKAPTVITTESNSGSYLKSKQAVEDFANTLAKGAGRDAREVKALWSENLKAKGITNADKLLPDAVIKSIEDAFEEGGEIFKLLNKTGLDVLKVLTNTNTAANSRAKGHKAGTQKEEQVITLDDRVLRPQFIYKYIQLDKETIYENRNSGALVKYILKELPQRIISEIERAVVIGDGRTDGANDKIKSLISLKDDAKTSKGYALTYTQATGENLVQSFIKALAKIKASGAKYLVTSPEALAELQLTETKQGNLILPVGVNLSQTFGLSGIITPEWMNATNDADNLGYIFAPSAYDIVGDSSIEAFTNFTLKENKQEYLQEVYIGGGLTKPASAVAIKKAAASRS